MKIFNLFTIHMFLNAIKKHSNDTLMIHKIAEDKKNREIDLCERLTTLLYELHTSMYISVCIHYVHIYMEQ